MKLGTAEAHPQLRYAGRIDAERAAPWAKGRKAGAERRDAGERFPFLALPTQHALALLAVLDADERRHCFDLVVPRLLERRVVHRRDTGREGRIVLRVNRQRFARGDLFQDGHDELAGRAIAFDESDEAGRQRSGWAHGLSLSAMTPLFVSE